MDEVRQKMEKASFTQSNNELKMFVVSAHDLTLVSLLRTLGFTYVPWKPDFSATLLIELHKINRHKHLVQVFTQNFFVNICLF